MLGRSGNGQSGGGNERAPTGIGRSVVEWAVRTNRCARVLRRGAAAPVVTARSVQSSSPHGSGQKCAPGDVVAPGEFGAQLGNAIKAPMDLVPAAESAWRDELGTSYPPHPSWYVAIGLRPLQSPRRLSIPPA